MTAAKEGQGAFGLGHTLLILGLRDRVRDALGHMADMPPGSHARGYFEGTAQAYAFVAEVLLRGGGQAPPEDRDGKAVVTVMPSQAAYAAGVEDGLAYVREAVALGDGPTPERLAVLRELAVPTGGWDEQAIYTMGSEAFGTLCGLPTAPELRRGAVWREACDAYNRGAAVGYRAARDEALGGIAWPEKAAP